MITQINDFIFCPRSIYFHDVYRNSLDTDLYQEKPQRVGQAAHKSVDTGQYSTRKNIITGIAVYSAHYNLLGRIDIFDCEAGLLTERKYSVTALYDGFRYQLYAQYFALTEMGYHVQHMRIHSSKDNRNYSVELPSKDETAQFEIVLNEIRNYRLDAPFVPNPKKCEHCIYNPLCDVCPVKA